MNATRLYWWQVNIGPGDGLVPSGNKPLPEQMVTQISVAIWCHYNELNTCKEKPLNVMCQYDPKK